MKFWVAITDKNWFEMLRAMGPDEVNFWQPSGTRVFRALQPGELFLFKLHSPDDFDVGGGRFVRYSALPASLAWDAFGTQAICRRRSTPREQFIDQPARGSCLPTGFPVPYLAQRAQVSRLAP